MSTTNPAAESIFFSHSGSVRLGGDGDLTVLSADPAVGDLRNFAHVLYAILTVDMLGMTRPEFSSMFQRRENTQPFAENQVAD